MLAGRLLGFDVDLLRFAWGVRAGPFLEQTLLDRDPLDSSSTASVYAGGEQAYDRI